MEGAWLKSYPKGVPAQIDVDTYASIVDAFEKSVTRFHDLPAFANLGTTLSFADVDRLTRDLAAYCQQELGLAKGDRLAIMMPNLLQYPIALFGALRAGLVVVNTNPLYTARELKHQLADSGASAIVIVENFGPVLAECLPETGIKKVITTQLGDLLSFPKSMVVNLAVKHVKRRVPAFNIENSIPFKQALSIGARRELHPVELGHGDLAFLQYTGGTTGIAKGAMLTHRNMVANMLQAEAWSSQIIKEGEEIIITALPLYHIFALLANCFLFFIKGGMNYLITNPRDLKGFVKQLRSVPFTAITGVNTLFNGLLETPGFAELDFSRLHIILGGGMPVQPAVAARWKEVTDTTLVEAYGLTEASPAICINPMDMEDYNGCVGLPVPSTECSIQDSDGKLLSPDQVGELCVRGPQVMKGYWNLPQETAAVLSKDGWLRTGDIATIDERGFVRLIDRKKDMILVSGFNVYPNEIEGVVAMHPGVAEVAAIGVPDAKSHEVVKIFVVRKDPELSAECLTGYCKERLAGYKVPKQIEFREELPKTNVGKILRRGLRDDVSNWHSQTV